ncbi:MAG TPA: aminotransferase class V-fold PLP-dependent enzyme [Vicinamibacterales bacterium]|nr:aminotransferase class V-fold PLP-dependent enzyme [Vicinamibacterales bacterium]
MANTHVGVSRRGFLGGTIAAAAAATLPGGGLAARVRAEGQVLTPTLSASGLQLSGTPDEAYWWKVRSQFNIIDAMTFMNNGTEGPVPRLVIDANERYFREIAENPSNNYRREEVDEVRAVLAGFVGADADEIAVTRSTTEGMNIFAHGLDWKAGDEVLFCTHEHGGGIGPYTSLAKRNGVNIVRIEIPSPPESVDQILGLYEKAITPRTKVIMVSHMTYVTGLVTPVKELAELAHRRGLLLSVDGAHPLGMLDLDLKALGVDHYSAAGQKWLMCGTGTGMCYIKRDVQERVWPLMGAPGDPKDGAKKYEAFGQRDVPSALGMTAAVDLQKAIGKKHVEARVRELSTRFRAGVKVIPGVKMWTSEDPRLSAGLTLFSVRDIPMANVQQAILNRDRIYIRTMGTGNLNACRAATHIYNMPDEVDRLLASIKHVSENASRYMAPTAA